MQDLFSIRPGYTLRFKYKNHKGAVAHRRVRVDSLRYGSTEFHPQPNQWFLHGTDLDKNEPRTFAMADIIEVFVPDPCVTCGSRNEPTEVCPTCDNQLCESCDMGKGTACLTCETADVESSDGW